MIPNEFERKFTKAEKEQGRRERRETMENHLEHRKLVEEALEAYEKKLDESVYDRVLLEQVQQIWEKYGQSGTGVMGRNQMR